MSLSQAHLLHSDIEGRTDKDCCTIVFVRAPEADKVKTRLAQKLNAAYVLDLYKSFTADILAMLVTGKHPVRICYHPAAAGAQTKAWLGDHLDYFSQKGQNLGQRMANAFSQTFAVGYQRVLLIGTDLPDLPATIVAQAFAALKTHAAVIGPSTDGGYYLIGFSADTFTADIFTAIPWGTAQVFEKTINIFKRRHCSVHILR